VTEVGTTRVAVAATATATALVVGVVGVVLAVDDRRRAASNITSPSPSGSTPSPTQSSQATPKPTPRVPQPAPLLLPNLRSLNASDLQIELVGNTRRLRFAASLANVGPGPLLLLPRGRGKCPSDQHEAVQLVHRDVNRDAKFQRRRDRQLYRRVTGCMLRHPDHKHWHFDAMAAYSLRRAGSSRVLVARNKVSFCLRDNLKVPRQRVVVPRRHFGRCSRNSQQGISPGWVDLYKADLSGQWLRLPANVGSELLCLDLEADPLHRLVETDETDNATSVAFRVDGTRVRRANSAACR
jgi:Lysyl oxidase